MMEKLRSNKTLQTVRSLAYRRRKLLIFLLICLVLVLPQMGIKTSVKRLIINTMIYSCLGLSLNLTTGYTGLVSLGHAAYYSIGAFVTAVLSTKLGWGYWPCIAASMLIAAASGFVVGLPSLRLTGSYLCVVTLGFAELVKVIELAWEPVTNGSRGIRGIPSPELFGQKLTVRNDGLYYLMFAVLLLVSLACWLLIRSKYGRALVFIKEDEQVSTMMGLRVFRYKITAFVFSAAIAGLAGAMFSYVIGYIDPYSFTFDTSITILCIVILGGMATMRGMYAGAALLIFLPELLRSFELWRFVVYGLLLVIMMRFRPQGLLGWRSRHAYGFPKGVDPDQISGKL